MNIDEINNLPISNFIEIFKNIFEKTISITKEAEKLRPYKNKKNLINSFFLIFDSLNLKRKLEIINKHPDLGDKIKINQGLTKLSYEEQSLSGLKDCTEDEYENMLTKMPVSVNWSRLQEFEKEDTTSGGRELACTAGVCEVVDLNAA